jgi:DNA-binding transcriptional MocR family regulator
MARLVQQLATPELGQLVAQLSVRYEKYRFRELKLDLTRGKPSTEQLKLSDAMDGVLQGNFRASDGTDVRNYGGLRGIPEARQLGATLMNTRPEWVMAGGNSSLTLMHQLVHAALSHGLWGAGSAWSDEAEASGRPIRFLCPVPGYDRHFTICESLGIEMVNVAIGPDGPDLAELELLLADDPNIKGIWCIPKYSNPTGCVYSDAVIRGLAELPKRAGRNFLILWDNAYGVHDFEFPARPLPDLMSYADAAGTADHVAMFTSTSKITFAGGGIGFLAASAAVLSAFEKRLSASTIGPDKVNQLRHARFLDGRIEDHMRAHAELVRPRFDAVLERLERDLGGREIASWTRPSGGYFISFDTMPGLAREVVKLAADVGVALTPAGATFTYGKDPDDRNIRLAPTFPSVADVTAATEVFTVCVQLATARKLLLSRTDR